MPSHDETQSCSLQSSPAKKTWVTPELQDQSVKSITEGVKSVDPSEFSPSIGPAS
ncbi:hypothetical protein SAMN05216593_101537 [Pseudomonas asturiensis]|uniref:Uncharacterized protein n=1 Tax=Pseudomonas asturiensis TaxID=1190415 RepID=A0A1M7JT53_9PSED|nr:hypothetical protein SAMN05216593_101537 [Pseudomonas asturiensis]